MTRKLTWLGGLGVVALTVLVACGGSSPSAQVASLAGSQSGDTTTTTTGTTSEADAQQAMLDFAQCMREHGIDMPDPQFDENGGILQKGPNIDPDRAKFKKAEEACRPAGELHDGTTGGAP
jgi:hypothetical protein